MTSSISARAGAARPNRTKRVAPSSRASRRKSFVARRDTASASTLSLDFTRRCRTTTPVSATKAALCCSTTVCSTLRARFASEVACSVVLSPCANAQRHGANG